MSNKDFGFAGYFPGEYVSGLQNIPTMAGKVEVQGYQYRSTLFECFVAGFRYDVRVSILLRKPAFRAKVMQSVLTEWVKKRKGRLLAIKHNARFVGRYATFFRYRLSSGVGEGYIFYRQGLMIQVSVAYSGKMGKQDYRRRLADAFYRRFRLLR
jgi:hypothetical protein